MCFDFSAVLLVYASLVKPLELFNIPQQNAKQILLVTSAIIEENGMNKMGRKNRL